MDWKTIVRCVNTSSLWRKKHHQHHPDEKHQNNHLFTIIVPQAPWWGGEYWGEGKNGGWKRKRKRTTREEKEWWVKEEKERGKRVTGQRARGYRRVAQQKREGGEHKKRGQTKPKLWKVWSKQNMVNSKWNEKVRESNYWPVTPFQYFEIGKFRLELINHKCGMFFTRTILAILGLWNPQPDPDEVRKNQTQA